MFFYCIYLWSIETNNERQPKEEQLKEEEIEIYAKNWEEKHLDRLKQEDKIIVEKRIKEMQDTKIEYSLLLSA